MRLDQTQIREILSRTDLGGFIGGYVQLRKRGNDLVGLCPFHGEKSPSFHVHPDRGFFKCFGCGAGGDAIKFLQLLENLSFPDAARALARRAGVELEPETPAAARVRSERERIFAANEAATAYFVEQLRLGKGTGPEAARAYVAGRGLQPGTVERFRLGYAPDGWDGLVRHLEGEGVELELAATAGLVKAGQRGHYDFYRNRLMIPTFATTGEPVAFGGRALDGSEPKYLNTSTTPVYTKGRGLYALGVARRAAVERESLLVVEGYLDCIALHQAGFTHAVAALGTSFTPEQAAELRKYAERIFLCFDADGAGLKATAKSIEILRAAGCVSYVVRLPGGDDPDTFVRTHGAEAFQARLDAALEDYGAKFLADRELDRLAELHLPPTRAAETFAEYLREHAAPEERDRLADHGEVRLGLARGDVRRRIRAFGPAHHAPRPGPFGSAAASASARPLGIGWNGATAFIASSGSRHVALGAEPPPQEREILAAFADEPALVDVYADAIPLELFGDPRCRAIYVTLRERRAELASAADLFAAFSDDRDAIDLLIALQKPDRSSLVRFADTTARRAHLDRVVEGYAESRLEARRRELDATVDAAFAAGTLASVEERAELDRLVEELERRRRKRLGAR